MGFGDSLYEVEAMESRIHLDATPAMAEIIFMVDESGSWIDYSTNANWANTANRLDQIATGIASQLSAAGVDARFGLRGLTYGDYNYFLANGTYNRSIPVNQQNDLLGSISEFCASTDLLSCDGCNGWGIGVEADLGVVECLEQYPIRRNASVSIIILSEEPEVHVTRPDLTEALQEIGDHNVMIHEIRRLACYDSTDNLIDILGILPSGDLCLAVPNSSEFVSSSQWYDPIGVDYELALDTGGSAWRLGYIYQKHPSVYPFVSDDVDNWINAVASTVASSAVVQADRTPNTIINGGDVQRNLVNSLSFEFSEAVSVTSAALEIARFDTSSQQWVEVTGLSTSFSFNSQTHTATWTLSQDLGDGQYMAVLTEDGVTLNSEAYLFPAGAFTYRFHQLDGDFDGNGSQGAGDIDRLIDMLGTGLVGYDLTGDSSVTTADVENLVTVRFGTYFGDANLDGVVSGADFLIWQNNCGLDGGWAEGNWNYDTTVSGADFLIWQNNCGQQNLNFALDSADPFEDFVWLGRALEEYLV